jgi:hypothetical protein
MPKEFTGSVEPQKDIQFGADERVNSANSLEGIEAAGKAFSEATGLLVQKSLTSDILAEDALQQSRYEEIRRKKDALYAAATSRDEASVARFQQEINDLTIAENQGLITGGNSSIRKESLLRSYVNRFPHREEEIRQTYSRTRAQLQEARASKISDPFEEGINDILLESTKKQKSPIAVLEDRQHQDAMERAARDLQYQVGLGKAVEGDVDAAVSKHAIPLFRSQADDYVLSALRMAEAGQGDIDHITVKKNLELMRSADLARLDGTFQNIANASAGDQGTPVLSGEFRAEQRKKVNDLYDGLIKYTENVDTLAAYARTMEHVKNATVAKIRSTVPAVAVLLDIGAVEWAGKFIVEDFPVVAGIAMSHGPAGVRAFIDNAPTPAEKQRRQYQSWLLGDGYTSEMQAEDLKGIVQSGAPPVRTGDPLVDATRLKAHTDAILRSSNVPPEVKDNALAAYNEAEKGDATYIGAGARWYKEPVMMQSLRKSETMKARMREETAGTLATVTRKIAESPALSQGLQFAVDLENDMKLHKSPWKAYASGGPFSIGTSDNPANVDFEQVARVPVIGMLVPDDKFVLDALNNAYWIIRGMDGAAAAEEWALQILAQRDADQEEAAAADEEAKKAGDEGFDLPTIDADLTD